jgi:hypothetical protein
VKQKIQEMEEYREFDLLDDFPSRYGKSMESFAEYTEEEFRCYLLENNVAAICDYIRTTRIPHRRSSEETFYSFDVPSFVDYLEKLASVLFNEGKRDLLLVLMELYLPLDYYIRAETGFSMMVEESDLQLFELYFKQGHTLKEMKGYVEEYIADYGTIDVLDFLLSFEVIPGKDEEGEEGEENGGEETERDERNSGHVLHSDIVYWASLYNNVDVLDRVLVRGYPINKITMLNDRRHQGTFPIYAAVNGVVDAGLARENEDTDAFERLIMYGADVNPFAEVRNSLLVEALINNVSLFDRLLELGARVINEEDIETIFECILPSREILEKLVKAGLDLSYCSSYGGTPLEILKQEEKSLMRSYENVDHIVAMKKIVCDLLDASVVPQENTT